VHLIVHDNIGFSQHAAKMECSKEVHSNVWKSNYNTQNRQFLFYGILSQMHKHPGSPGLKKNVFYIVFFFATMHRQQKG
jgi:hypothetical protein